MNAESYAGHAVRGKNSTQKWPNFDPPALPGKLQLVLAPQQYRAQSASQAGEEHKHDAKQD
jgi:hypothetical protein